MLSRLVGIETLGVYYTAQRDTEKHAGTKANSKKLLLKIAPYRNESLEPEVTTTAAAAGSPCSILSLVSWVSTMQPCDILKVDTGHRSPFLISQLLCVEMYSSPTLRAVSLKTISMNMPFDGIRICVVIVTPTQFTHDCSALFTAVGSVRSYD